MKMARLCILFSLTAVCAMAQPDNPCTSYHTLNDSSMVLSYTSTASCAGHITSGDWYRFQGTTEGLLATECPTGNQCGTSNQVWMLGNDPPSVNDTIQSVVICLKADKECCDRRQRLNITYCNTFVVYQLIALPSTTPCSQYCFNQSSDAFYLPSTTSPTTAPTTTTVPITTSTTSTTTPTTMLSTTTTPTTLPTTATPTTTLPTTTTKTTTLPTTAPPTTTLPTTKTPTTTHTTPTTLTTYMQFSTTTATTQTTKLMAAMTKSTTSTPTTTTTKPTTTANKTPTTTTTAAHSLSSTTHSTSSTRTATRSTYSSRIITATEIAASITTSNTTIDVLSTEGNSNTSTDNSESFFSANKVWISTGAAAGGLAIIVLVVFCIKRRIQSGRKANAGSNRTRLHGIPVAQEDRTNAIELHDNPGQSRNRNQRLSKGNDFLGSTVHTKF